MAGETTQPAPPSGVEVAPGVFVAESALRFSSTRSSGPGGQNVNKLSTKIRLHIAVDALTRAMTTASIRQLRSIAGSRLSNDGDLIFTCDESRSARMNRATCLQRLRQLLIQAMHRPRIRRKKRVSSASKRRRLDAKRHQSRVKQLRRKPGIE